MALEAAHPCVGTWHPISSQNCLQPKRSLRWQLTFQELTSLLLQARIVLRPATAQQELR